MRRREHYTRKNALWDPYWNLIPFAIMSDNRKQVTGGSAAKRAKVCGKFLQQWITQFRGVIVASANGCEFVRCTVCSRDVKVAASGVFDVRAHIATALHKGNEAKAKTFTPITQFFGTKPETSSAVTKAEVLFAQFVAEHNLAASVADHFTDLVKTMFPDSAIAKSFRSKRTKTTQVCIEMCVKMFKNGMVTLTRIKFMVGFTQ